jgi:hypothetical protein
VVLDEAAEPAWRKGRPELASREGPTIVHATADEGRLPEAHRAWRGREVRLVRADGTACEGKVTGFALVGQLVPHFSAEQVWRGDFEEGDAPWTDEEIAADAWELASGVSLVLAARVDGDRCADAIWAQPADRPAPVAGTPEPAPAALAQAARAAFQRLPAWRATQKTYVEEADLPRAPHWDLHMGAESHVTLLRHPSGAAYVAVGARAGEGCGEWAGSLFAIWEVTGGDLERPRLRLVSDPEALDPRRLVGVVDVDGDGRLELLWIDDLATGVLRLVGERYQPAGELAIAYLDCGC